MTVLPYFIFSLLVSRFIYAAFSAEDYPFEKYYRPKSDDSFPQFDGVEVASESLVKVPVVEYEAEMGVSLTIESLSQMSGDNYYKAIQSCSSKTDSSSLKELLSMKSSSSSKSHDGEAFTHEDRALSDLSTIDWCPPRNKSLSKFPSDVLILNLSFDEAPTESNSTSDSPSQTVPLPDTLKQVLESKLVLESIVGFLDPRSIIKFASTSSSVQKYLNNYGMACFKDLFPSLDGLDDSIVALRELTKLLQEPELKFNEWLEFNVRNIHPITNLASFINYRRGNVKKPNEIFALIDLIEFLRLSDWHQYFTTLPGPLNLILSENIFENHQFKREYKEKIMVFIMKAAHYGNLRVLKAIKDDILRSFPELGPFLILKLFLLETEKRQEIHWTPFQRSVHAQSTNTACFFFYTLTSDSKIIKAFYKILLESATSEEASQMPNLMDRIFFPYLSNRKISDILKKRLLNFSNDKGIRPIHFAVAKAKIPEIVKLFFNLEIGYNGPISSEEFSTYLQLAFASKSLVSLRVIRQLFDDNNRIPVEIAVCTDWPLGLQEYSELMHFKSYLYRYNNLFHVIARKNAKNILEYLCTSVFETGEILQLMEQVDGYLKKPIDVALEAGNYEMLLLLQRFGAKINRKFLIKILETNAKLLDNFILDQQEKEIFARSFINFETSVTLMEWSIISGNQQALDWFLETVPVQYWRLFDGAGNTPIHLAVIVGNMEALRKLLDLDPTLINIRNRINETPSNLAYRIRDKTRTCEKMFVIDGIIQLFFERRIE